MYRLDCSTDRSYAVAPVTGVLDPADRSLADVLGGRRCLVVVDPEVDRLHGADLRAYLATLPGPVDVLVLTGLDERTKTLDTALRVVTAAQDAQLGRRDLLVAVGGGVCCDVVTVAASLVRRGIRYVCVPTTLLAQVDAGIGLKGGVNFGGRKNYLGCFEPPAAVLVDPAFLATTAPREIRCGLAEVLKMALVRDAGLFDDLARHGAELAASSFTRPAGVGGHVVGRAIELMLEELGRDCYEQGPLRRLVDFGHTFSVQLEEDSGYLLPHGEAVAVDMALTCAVGVELGLLAEADLARVLRAYAAIGLPTTSSWCSVSAARAGMEGAVRHRDGALNLVVPTAIGQATFVPDLESVRDDVLRRALARLSGPPAAGRPRLPAPGTHPVAPAHAR